MEIFASGYNQPIMGRFIGAIELIAPDCNLSTIKDGRGGIFSWVPDEPIMEWSLLYFNANKVRGNHYHPEFTEYFLIADGAVVLVTKDPVTGGDVNILLGKGSCFKTPPHTAHAVHAIQPSICVSFLTKPWSQCSDPIVFEDIIPFDKEYNDFIERQR